MESAKESYSKCPGLTVFSIIVIVVIFILSVILFIKYAVPYIRRSLDRYSIFNDILNGSAKDLHKYDTINPFGVGPKKQPSPIDVSTNTPATTTSINTPNTAQSNEVSPNIDKILAKVNES